MAYTSGERPIISLVSGFAPRTSSSFAIVSSAASTAQNSTRSYILPYISPLSRHGMLKSATASSSSSTSVRSFVCTAASSGCTQSS